MARLGLFGSGRRHLGAAVTLGMSGQEQAHFSSEMPELGSQVEDLEPTYQANFSRLLILFEGNELRLHVAIPLRWCPLSKLFLQFLHTAHDFLHGVLGATDLGGLTLLQLFGRCSCQAILLLQSLDRWTLLWAISLLSTPGSSYAVMSQWNGNAYACCFHFGVLGCWKENGPMPA